MTGILRKLRSYAVEDKFFYHLRIVIDGAIGRVVRKLAYRRGRIVPNKLFVITYDDVCTCNPKYIVEELLRRGLPIDIVWVAPVDGDLPYDRFPPGVRLVRRRSAEMFEEMASAHVWLDNALGCVWYDMPKKKGQVYLNTWHGSMGIKKLGGNSAWLKRAKRCNRLTDYMITNSTFEEDVFKTTFWPDVPVLRFGHARNDILFNSKKSSEVRETICRKLGINDPEARLFLYAPTFRDDGDLRWFDLDFERLRQCLENRFGKHWKILVRMHFKDRALAENKCRFNDWLINLSLYPDMQELMAAADAGLTDYSSWAYDYILTRRPLFLYVPDEAKYDQERGFYYPLASTPFPMACTQEELEKAISDFDEAAYQTGVEDFLADKGCYEEGHACKKIADFIAELTQTSAENRQDRR